MARKGLCLLLAAGLLLGAPLRFGAAADDDHEKKILNLLAVQKALQEGRDALKRGDYQAAVAVLEGRLASIDGDKDYLETLRDAYIGHIRELQQNNRPADVLTFTRRLECCDPGALLELNSTPHTAAAIPVSKPPTKTSDHVSAAPAAVAQPTDEHAKARATPGRSAKSIGTPL